MIQRRKLDMSDWQENHCHWVGQDGFNDEGEISLEEMLEERAKEDKLYLQRNPLCTALFHCEHCDNKFEARASERHRCPCDNTSYAKELWILKDKRKGVNSYAKIRE